MLAALKSSSSNIHSNNQNYAIFIFCSLNKNEETKRKKTEIETQNVIALFWVPAPNKQTDTGRHKDRLTNEMNKYTKNKQTNKQTYIQQQQLKLTDEVYNKFMAHSVVIHSVHNSQTKRTTS